MSRGGDLSAAPPTAIGGARLTDDLRQLGVRPGAILMVHTRMSALGWVVGGSETVVRALLDAVGPRGTLAAYVSWEEHVYQASEWPVEHREAYRAQPPVFDPATAESVRGHGRIPERIRTWPGAERSCHPEASVAAIGPRARELTENHPQDDAYGPDSPFARLVGAGGQVLMLGAPLETVTLLHHAEAIAEVPEKRTVTFEIPVAGAGGRVTARTFRDIDTTDGAFPYDGLGLAADPFEVIARAALGEAIGTSGRVAGAESRLFGAAELTAFAVRWMEERFGGKAA